MSDANHKKVFHRNALQNFFKDPQPVSEEDFFNLLVAEIAFDQFASEIARVRMISEIGNEMRRRQFRGELLLRRIGPLCMNKLEEIESDSDVIDADQINDVFDVIDVAIERALFLFRTN